MPVTRRSRLLEAPPGSIWRVVSDPHQLPRWWPAVRRVEGVGSDRFTQVLLTAKDRPVRLDMRIAVTDPGSAVAWEQELAGTPFARHLAEAVTSVALAAEGAGTRVTLEQRQRLRGLSRGGGWMLRRATARRLEEALHRLDELLG